MPLGGGLAGGGSVLDSIANLARVYDGQRRYSEAAALAQRAVAGWERLKVTDRAELGDARLALGRAFAGLRRYRDAERELLEAERVLSREKTPRHRATLEALAAMYTSWEGSDPGRGHEGQAAVWRARLGKN